MTVSMLSLSFSTLDINVGITHPTLPGKPDKAQKQEDLTLNTIPNLGAGWVLPNADILVQVMATTIVEPKPRASPPGRPSKHGLLTYVAQI